jgi:hypothetical protein
MSSSLSEQGRQKAYAVLKMKNVIATIWTREGCQ